MKFYLVMLLLANYKPYMYSKFDFTKMRMSFLYKLNNLIIVFILFFWVLEIFVLFYFILSHNTFIIILPSSLLILYYLNTCIVKHCVLMYNKITNGNMLKQNCTINKFTMMY